MYEIRHALWWNEFSELMIWHPGILTRYPTKNKQNRLSIDSQVFGFYRDTKQKSYQILSRQVQNSTTIAYSNQLIFLSFLKMPLSFNRWRYNLEVIHLITVLVACISWLVKLLEFGQNWLTFLLKLSIFLKEFMPNFMQSSEILQLKFFFIDNG